MGVKERRTKILLGLFLLSDVNFSPIQINHFAEQAFDIRLNQKTKSTLKEMIKTNLISEEESSSASTETADIKQKTTRVYRLTEIGYNALSLHFPFCRFLRNSWDHKWRILSYEIPESKREIRDRLRREVAGWGLGPWHRSFWLTPHPIIENLRNLVHQKEEEQYIQAFEADHTVGDRDILIEKVWQKSALENKYRDVFKLWHQILSSGEAKENKFTKVVAAYVDVIRNDPGLPKELIGDNWIGFEAYSIYKEIRTILLS